MPLSGHAWTLYRHLLDRPAGLPETRPWRGRLRDPEVGEIGLTGALTAGSTGTLYISATRAPLGR